MSEIRESEQVAKRLVNALNGPGWGNLDDVQRAKAVQVVEAAVAEAVRKERARLHDLFHYKANAAEARGAMNEAGGYYSAMKTIRQEDKP